jgi:hypothetical protein
MRGKARFRVAAGAWGLILLGLIATKFLRETRVGTRLPATLRTRPGIAKPGPAGDPGLSIQIPPRRGGG